MSELIRYIMNKESVLNIGFDDTDSPTGMCTTFLAYKIVDLLQKQKTEFLDFPKLIRFNPNIPWKTRGNGAVSLKIKTRNPSKIKNQIKNLVSSILILKMEQILDLFFLKMILFLLNLLNLVI